MKRFYLDRKEDVSGTSGTGRVAEGTQFSDGKCVIHWLSELDSIEVCKDVETLIKIHGHSGKTFITFVD